MKRCLLSLFAFLCVAFSQAQVISQIYTTGGNNDASFRRDFVEILNNTGAPINLTGFSVQFAGGQTATGLFTLLAPLNGILQPGQYFLVQLGGTITNPDGMALPTPDAIGTLNIAADAGKVILVNSTVPVPIAASGCPAPAVGSSMLDFIGYGGGSGANGTNCAEGADPETATNDNANSNKRILNGCTDNDNNQTDFINNQVANPRNTTAARTSCPTGATLPVTFAKVKAENKANLVQISFSNLTETDVVMYQVERSANGQTFTAIAQLAPTKNDGEEARYSFTDAAPLAGINIYRISCTEDNGKQTYSTLLKIDRAAKGMGLAIAPNPAKGSTLNLQISNLPAGIYQMKIYTSNGQLLSTEKLVHNGNSLTQTMPLPQLHKGLYYCELSGPVRLQTQFIKE